MKRFFQRIRNSFARFMYGRYGNDELNLALTIASLISLLLSIIPYVGFVFLFLAIFLIVWSNIRAFSRNIPKRRRQLERYFRIKNKPKNARTLRKNKKRDKKTHIYFKCHKCRAVLRVPRGKGNIIVTCPRCNERIPKNT